ncbi:MAG: CBS domain-containing protein [Thalassotalea sp.]|nr:CBS domain-containing protein [Thalassotalea sp.]
MGEQVVGILTEADCTKLDFSTNDVFTAPVSQYMRSPVISIAHDTRHREIIQTFHRHNIRHLLVKDNENITGIINQTDVVRRQGIEHYLQLKSIADNYNSRVAVFQGTVALCDAVSAMAHHKHSAVIVFNQATNEHGIITERDLLKILARGESHKEHLWKYAPHPLITINSEETLLQGFLTLQQYRIRHLGVTDKDGNVIGLLALQNILSGC